MNWNCWTTAAAVFTSVRTLSKGSSLHMKCSVQECNRDIYARGWCEMHYARWRRSGKDPAAWTHGNVGNRNGNWRGDATGYAGVHFRLRDGLGKATGSQCADKCGRTATQWSYSGGAPDEMVDPLSGPYSPDLNYYAPRCGQCHRQRDSARGVDHGNAKLTETEVLAIRKAAASGATQRAIAQQYGLAQSNVSLIVRRKTWCHI